MERAMKSIHSLLFPALAALAACNSSSATGYSPPPQPHHFYITYYDHGDSTTVGIVMDEFRDRIGGNLNAPNAPPAVTGRREINWDGVPAALTNVDTFPLNFFNVNSKRGGLHHARDRNQDRQHLLCVGGHRPQVRIQGLLR
jgi:hypothetical protein